MPKSKHSKVAEKITQLVVLFVVMTGKKLALKSQHSTVHRGRVISPPCHKHCLNKEGGITEEKLVRKALMSCFGIENVPCTKGIDFKIGKNQFHVYHVEALALGNRILTNPKYFFEEIKKVKNRKKVNLKEMGEHTIPKSCQRTLISIPKVSAANAA